MIVIGNPEPLGATGAMLLVRQPEHAAGCKQLAAAWRRPDAIPLGMWTRFVAAVGRHDDGWIEAEYRPGVDGSGQPYHFKSMPTDQHVTIWRRSVELAQRDDPYAALVIALHARWLYTKFSLGESVEEQKLAQAFIDGLSQRIEALILRLAQGRPDEQTAVEPATLAAAQRLLSFFDAVSLMLLGAVRWTVKSEPVAFGGRRCAVELERAADDSSTIRVKPWPFEPPTVRVQTRASILDQASFSGPDDLARAMAAAPVIDLAWSLAA